MYNRVVLAMVALSFLGTVSCSGKKESESYSVTEDPKAAVVGSPLYVVVSSNYELQKDEETVGNCYFDANAPYGSKTCTLRIPEMKLYFSELNFTVGTSDTTTCAHVAFYPYYYRISKSATYTPPGETDPIDCLNEDHARCYGGAAVSMMSDFPTSSGKYFLPVNTLYTAYKLKSGNTLRESRALEPASATNINSCNNLPSGQRGAPFSSNGAVYSGDEYQDYIAQCSDKWGEVLYQIKLIIGDDDLLDTSSNTTYDTRYDWGN